MSEKQSKLVWASRIFAAAAAIATLISLADLGPMATKVAMVSVLVLGELGRRCEQWLPQRSGAAQNQESKGGG